MALGGGGGGWVEVASFLNSLGLLQGKYIDPCTEKKETKICKGSGYIMKETAEVCGITQ